MWKGRDVRPALPTRHFFCQTINAWERRPSALVNHRSRSRPCPCKSSCLCSRCRSIYIHPCPCRSSDPCKHAFPSPCRLPVLDRTEQRSARLREDSTLVSLCWCLPTNLPALRQQLEPSLTWSFPELPPIGFELLTSPSFTTLGRRFWIAGVGLLIGTGWSQARK